MFYSIDYMTVMQNWAHSDVAKLWSGWNALRNGLFGHGGNLVHGDDPYIFCVPDFSASYLHSS